MKKDFRVGDKVTKITIQKGEICDVEVFAGTPRVSSFTGSGKEDFIFHGHNVTFEVHGEEPPERTVTRWVNISFHKHVGAVVCGKLWKTKEAAIRNSSASDLVTALEIEIPEPEMSE